MGQYPTTHIPWSAISYVTFSTFYFERLQAIFKKSNLSCIPTPFQINYMHFKSHYLTLDTYHYANNKICKYNATLCFNIRLQQRATTHFFIHQCTKKIASIHNINSDFAMMEATSYTYLMILYCLVFEHISTF